MVGTNLHDLVSSHQDSIKMFGWVEEDLDVACAAFLPLVKVAVPSVQLGSLLKQDFLVLLSRLRLHLRGTQNSKMKLSL